MACVILYLLFTSMDFPAVLQMLSLCCVCLFLLQILATCEEMIPAIVKFSHLVTDQFLPCTVHEEFM